MSNEIQFILYQLPDEEGKVQVVIKDETIWATQKAMAQLFGVNIPAISKHLKNIFDEGELKPDATVSKMEIVQMEGEREVERGTSFYSLDAIIAVGYRVSSARATKFRQWATSVLKEFIKKGRGKIQTLQPHAADRLRLRQRGERGARRKVVARSFRRRSKVSALRRVLLPIRQPTRWIPNC